jgi:hypothetical protein
MLNQGRPTIEGRAKRSPNNEGRWPGMGRARVRRVGEGTEGGCLLMLIDAVPVEARPHSGQRVSGANTAVDWVGRRTCSPGGDKT